MQLWHIAVGVIILVVLVLVYSACAAAGNSDERLGIK